MNFFESRNGIVYRDIGIAIKRIRPGMAAIAVAMEGPTFDPFGANAETKIPRKVRSGLAHIIKMTVQIPGPDIGRKTLGKSSNGIGQRT